MPDVSRVPFRFDCQGGLDLVHPIDRMPPGHYPYLFNVRVIQEGRIEGRPGYSEQIVLQDQPNSIRRLNDPSKQLSGAGYIYVGGGGTKLYSGIEGVYLPRDTGYSGLPLSLIPFRPEQSPQAWMYVYDKNKLAKVRPDNTVRAIGVAPPSIEPYIDYGVPADVMITAGQSAAGWAATGDASAPVQQDRTSGSTPSIVTILYNDGTSGWCCINPNITQPFWMGDRMKVILNPGGLNEEIVTVRNILNAIPDTTIAAIQYDMGTDGFFSAVLTSSASGLQRNSLIQIDAEVIRVLAVIPEPLGSGYSIRGFSGASHTAGAVVTGLISWYCYTNVQHLSGELVRSQYVHLTQASAGTGAVHIAFNTDVSSASGRPVDPANDYLHISIFLDNPHNLTSVKLLLSLDQTPNYNFDNPGNSYIWTLTQTQLNAQGASDNSWVEVVVPISEAIRSGSDSSRSLATVSGLAIQVVSTGACNWGFDWWYLFGTYGPVVQPNAPTGLAYLTRFRDSTTGAHSVPGPFTRYELFPLREAVLVTPATTTQSGVDSIDIYRLGGTVSSPLYVGTLFNDTSTPRTYLDGLPDTAVLATNQTPDTGALQPWPLLVAPWQGEVMVIGTSVIWVSGTKFSTALVGGSVILINGTAYQTYGQPRSDEFLEITKDAGFLASANFQVASPTLAGQPLPYAFGPLEGPFAPVILALGDPLNAGTLYWTNFSDADGASDQNTAELESPSEDLVSGDVWNGLALVGTEQRLFCVRYSYLSGAGSSPFQWSEVKVPSGIWSRWACCSCPLGLAYLGRDGIYIATDAGGVSITDGTLYPLFPHDGQPAKPVNSGSNIILPVDMSLSNNLRLTYCDESLRFSYVDTGGNWNTLIYEISKKRWFLNHYANAINLHYLEEEVSAVPRRQEILMMSMETNSFMRSGGSTDNNAPIDSIALTPSIDEGDERAQKLYVDAMVQADGGGTLQWAATYDNAQSFSAVLDVPMIGAIGQFLQNIASLSDLTLHRNVGAKFAWTGGPDGPKLYAWEISGFRQPYLSAHFVTQFFAFSFPGWKHMRRMFPALISNGPVVFTVKCQDGRTFTYEIPSTGGQFKILPQMMDQNIKDLAFALELDGGRLKFAFFPSDFTLEVKEWTEETYIKLAVFNA